MKSEYFSPFKRFFLFTVALVALAGCGSSNSTSTTTTSDTGSVAVKLIWSASGSSQRKAVEKVLYAAPAGVTTVRIIVSAGTGPAMTDIPINFPASAGTGTVSGIPPGTGRTVTAQGLDAGGIIRYQATASNIDIVAGTVTNAGIITMLAPVTTASPAGASGLTSLPPVTLTSSPGATIYYTTNGVDPTTSSTNGPSPITGIPIISDTILKFFAIDAGNAQEAVKTETYTFITGSATVTW